MLVKEREGIHSIFRSPHSAHKRFWVVYSQLCTVYIYIFLRDTETTKRSFVSRKSDQVLFQQFSGSWGGGREMSVAY